MYRSIIIIWYNINSRRVLNSVWLDKLRVEKVENGSKVCWLKSGKVGKVGRVQQVDNVVWLSERRFKFKGRTHSKN